MKAKYIAPDIYVIEYTEEVSLLAASAASIEIDDNQPSDYWTMGAKQEGTRPGGYRPWNDAEDYADLLNDDMNYIE